MAGFRLRLYGPPAEEIGAVRRPQAPRWTVRLYWTYGVEDPEQAPLSAAVEAVAEGLHERLKTLVKVLRKLEAEGWVTIVEDDEVRVVNDRSREQTHEILERQGVWGLAHHLAVKDSSGEIAWLS